MQHILANTNRRIRPNQIKRHIRRNLIGGDRTNVPHTIELGIAPSQIQRAFIHVQCPNISLRRSKTKCQRNRTPTATQIKERTLLRRLRSLTKQHGRSQIHAIAGKHAIGNLNIGLIAAQHNMQPLTYILRLRISREILFGLCHTHSLQTLAYGTTQATLVHVANARYPCL